MNGPETVCPGADSHEEPAAREGASGSFGALGHSAVVRVSAARLNEAVPAAAGDCEWLSLELRAAVRLSTASNLLIEHRVAKNQRCANGETELFDPSCNTDRGV